MLSTRFKQAREHQGLTQEELGKLINVSQQAIQKIEDGRTKIPRKITELAQILDVTSEWLLIGADEYRPKCLISDMDEHRKNTTTNAVREPLGDLLYMDEEMSERSRMMIIYLIQKIANGLLTEQDIDALDRIVERLASRKE